MSSLELFVKESNWIEGIKREPLPQELQAHERFLASDGIYPELFVEFVKVVQPGAVLRNKPGLDVRVGDHTPPRGNANIYFKLLVICNQVMGGELDVYNAHVAYEALHPFTDGNGRSGRALWLWMMSGPDNVPLGFLHHWYYQSLSGDRVSR